MRKSWRNLWQTLWQPAEDYRLVVAVFLKALGLIYAIAFASLAVQIEGLAGSYGILPLVEQQANLKAALGAERFFAFPSVFWLGASDTALVSAAGLGAAAGLMLALAVWPRVALVVAV